MKVRKLTAKEAKKLLRELGLGYMGADDGRSFYATNEDETEVWEFDTKRERDAFIARHAEA